MIHVIALILSVLTSALSAVVMLITGVAGCFLWPPIILLCVVLGYLFRRSPLSRVCYAFPFCGLSVMVTFAFCLSRYDGHPERFPDASLIDIILFLLISGLSLWFVHSGYLRALRGTVVGATSEEVEKAMLADEGADSV